MFEIIIESLVQNFTVAINEKSFVFNLSWKETELGGWFFSVYDENNKAVCLNERLVPNINLMEQFKYICEFELYLLSNLDGYPNQGQLGNDFKLYYR